MPGTKVRHSHLSLPDRRRIERWRQAKISPGEMARRMGRHRSTIFRELRRSHFHDREVPTLSGYRGIVAQGLSDGRRMPRRKLVRELGLRDQVERCLRSDWTPEQIAGRMRRRGYRLRKRPPPEFAPELSILFRLDVIAHCREFGHREADLVLFRQKFGPANIARRSSAPAASWWC